MRLKRLIQKKSKKFLINRLRNNFSTIFQSYNISDKKFCNIPYVDLKFFKDSILAKKNGTLRVKIDGQILPKLLVTGKFDEFLFKFLKKKTKKENFIYRCWFKSWICFKTGFHYRFCKKDYILRTFSGLI